MRIDFLTHLTFGLLESCQRCEFHNVDEIRFPPSSSPFSLRAFIRSKVVELARARGFYRSSPIACDVLREVLDIDGLDRTYELLADQTSRDLFVKILAYRILGHQHVRLPLNDPKYWERRASIHNLIEKRDTVKDVPLLGSLNLYNYKGMRLHMHQLNVEALMLDQYRCQRAGVGVQSGDIVIDAGGCWGDTALDFARDAAHVFCFECMPSNIGVIQQNLALNPSLSNKVTVIQRALWSRSGETIIFKDAGPGSRADAGSGVVVPTGAIDDFVTEQSVPRVDFIKMDIEGAEPEALKGALRTIRNCRPQLAISVYHDIEHFASIPRWISGLDLGYRLYLDHFTIHAEETIVFARVDR